jgi:hypothetical protein
LLKTVVLFWLQTHYFLIYSDELVKF